MGYRHTHQVMGAVAAEGFNNTSQDAIAYKIATQHTTPPGFLARHQKKCRAKNQQAQGHIQLCGMYSKRLGRVRPDAPLVHMLMPGEGIARKVYAPRQAGGSTPTTAVTQTPDAREGFSERKKRSGQIKKGQERNSKDARVERYGEQATCKASVEDKPAAG